MICNREEKKSMKNNLPMKIQKCKPSIFIFFKFFWIVVDHSSTFFFCLELSPLIQAAVHGRLVILDNIDRLSEGSLSVLQQLIQDREATLYDG